jgi:hypothetical protein
MKPSESAWNFVPISTALGSLSAPAGIVALLQMLHGQEPGAGPVVNDQLKSAAMALPATSSTPLPPSAPPPTPPRILAVKVVR